MYFRNTCKRKGKEVCFLFRIVWKAVKLWPEQRGASYTAARPRWFRANACSKSLQNHINGWHRSCPTLSWCVCQARSVKMFESLCVADPFRTEQTTDADLANPESPPTIQISSDLGDGESSLLWFVISVIFIFYVLFSIITCRFNSDSLQVTTLKSSFFIVLLSISNNLTEMFLIVHSFIFLHFRTC